MANKGDLAVFIFGIVVFFVCVMLVGRYESFLLLQVMGLANDVYV